jgi:hypothetical protein
MAPTPAPPPPDRAGVHEARVGLRDAHEALEHAHGRACRGALCGAALELVVLDEHALALGRQARLQRPLHPRHVRLQLPHVPQRAQAGAAAARGRPRALLARRVAVEDVGADALVALLCGQCGSGSEVQGTPRGASMHRGPVVRHRGSFGLRR